MHSEVDARESDCERQQVQGRRRPRHGGGEHGRAREARRRMPGRERARVRNCDERVSGRPSLVHRALEQRGDPVRGRVRNEDGREGKPVAPRECEQQPECEPDRTPGADLRQPNEHLVQRVPPVVDDPPFEMTIESGQTGRICFACSISCCRSNGFPTNACAPRSAASACACSSALPLNMTTGIAPTP